MTEEMTIISMEAYRAAKEVLEAAKLKAGALFVVGCSTSEGSEPFPARSWPRRCLEEFTRRPRRLLCILRPSAASI